MGSHCRSQCTQGSGAKGFSLIELIVVLVILGLLASIIGPNVMDRLTKARISITVNQIDGMESALALFKLDVGRVPTTDEGLTALLRDPGTVSGWSGPYLQKNVIPLDPWKQAYRYVSPGVHGDYDLSSFGPDGREGGAGNDADITSWAP